MHRQTENCIKAPSAHRLRPASSPVLVRDQNPSGDDQPDDDDREQRATPTGHVTHHDTDARRRQCERQKHNGTDPSHDGITLSPPPAPLPQSSASRLLPFPAPYPS